MPAARKPNKWKTTFQQMVENSLRNSIALVESNPNAPQSFRPHMDSMTRQIHWGNQFAPELASRLMVAAYPWPARWGLTDTWRDQLEQARPLNRQTQACLADIFQFTGQPERALEIADALFSDPTTPPDEFALLVTRGGGAWLSALVSQGKIIEAEQAAQGLLDRLESDSGQSNSARKAEAQSIVWTHQSSIARRKSNPSLALDLISQAIQKLESEPSIDRSSMSEIIQSRAICHWVGTNYTEALADLDYAEDVSASVNDTIGLCSVHGNRGLFYWSMSEYDKAEVELLEAIRLSEKNRFTYLLMKQVGNLGMVYFNRGNLQKALLYIDREIELAEISNDEYEKALAEGNKAAVQVYTGQPGQALPALLSALQKYTDTGRFEPLVGTLVDLSACHYRIGDLEQSSRYARRALEMARGNNNHSLILIASRVCALTAPAPEALELLTDALQLAERLDHKLDIAGCRIFLAHLTPDPASRISLWAEAAVLLEQIGAARWIEGKHAGDAVLLPLTV
jgi:tetratricopeptide (TPR) repeat protein